MSEFHSLLWIADWAASISWGLQGRQQNQWKDSVAWEGKNGVLVYVWEAYTYIPYFQLWKK